VCSSDLNRLTAGKNTTHIYITHDSWISVYTFLKTTLKKIRNCFRIPQNRILSYTDFQGKNGLHYKDMGTVAFYVYLHMS
jgi:hypothetical protein